MILAPANEHYSQLRESRDHCRNEVRFKHVTEVEASSTCSVSTYEHSRPPLFFVQGDPTFPLLSYFPYLVLVQNFFDFTILEKIFIEQ